MTKTLFVPERIAQERSTAAKKATVSSNLNTLDPSKFGLPKEDDSLSALEKLPKPTGWRILILPYIMPSETKNGIILSDETVERNRIATNVGYVVSVGPDAYKDKDKFPDGPWCKKGDWVMFGRYAGSKFKIIDAEPRLLNDDEILATIGHPSDILHVL